MRQALPRGLPRPRAAAGARRRRLALPRLRGGRVRRLRRRGRAAPLRRLPARLAPPLPHAPARGGAPPPAAPTAPPRPPPRPGEHRAPFCTTPRPRRARCRAASGRARRAAAPSSNPSCSAHTSSRSRARNPLASCRRGGGRRRGRRRRAARGGGQEGRASSGAERRGGRRTSGASAAGTRREAACATTYRGDRESGPPGRSRWPASEDCVCVYPARGAARRADRAAAARARSIRRCEIREVRGHTESTRPVFRCRLSQAAPTCLRFHAGTSQGCWTTGSRRACSRCPTCTAAR